MPKGQTRIRQEDNIQSLVTGGHIEINQKQYLESIRDKNASGLS